MIAVVQDFLTSEASLVGEWVNAEDNLNDHRFIKYPQQSSLAPVAPHGPHLRVLDLMIPQTFSYSLRMFSGRRAILISVLSFHL